MAGAFMAYMALKGLRQIWRPSMPEIAFFSGLAFALAYALSRPYIAARVRLLANRRYDINSLFTLPLIAGAALLSFDHGANDVANAVGPLGALVSTVQHQSAKAEDRQRVV